jgi:hypothetical protein
MHTGDTTQRMSTTTVLDELRNVRRRLALLTVRATNRKLNAEEKADYAQLQVRERKLDREYYDAMQWAKQQAQQ